ncbi:fluoride efflux transporter CrcB [Haliovirga abyssi]|uniref:Fluoride-specific ion channel FluC n=1 Tax=Haliovirga abyssi TaxID=2996794 RepID=A0AAU9DJF9_9FUSO|nr:fluoride efflux transporter CrcB [Haliovirga abyssi]BDU50022.1 putative fluoride ion transporter CrcB [Haliovirga abyssi]
MGIKTMLAIGTGGFIGANLRSYINGVVNEKIVHHLPLGTLTVNLLGSLTLGVLFAFFTYTHIFSPRMKSLLSTGMMGALTTYSTFAMETFFLIEGESYALAILNMGFNVIGTVMFAGIGFKVTEMLLKAH